MNLNLIEKSISRIQVTALHSLVTKQGTEVLVYREKVFDANTMTPTKSVYGRYAGTKQADNELITDQVLKVRMLIGGDPFNAQSSSFDFGIPESVNGYTLETDIQVGDSIVIARDDKERLELKVFGKQSIGLSTKVLTRYELSPITLPTDDIGVL